MNEQAARNVLLVRAVESTDRERTLITEADRAHAARAAGELARWSASERGEQASAEQFIAKRGELLAVKLVERDRAFSKAANVLAWRPWIGVALPIAAFAFGAFFQQIGDRQHINVLAFPLLTIVAWNLIVYVLIAIAALRRLRSGGRTPSGIRRAIAGVARRGATRARGIAGAAIGAFVDDWTRASGPLLIARAGRVLHLSAALLALGAIAGLYVRGVVFEYRAGWESTFLDASQVHSLLSALLSPAARFLGMPFPDVVQLEAIRWPGSTGENAARWIHWYAVTVAALVVLPRLALAGWDRWQERRLEARFPVALEEPYFRRLLSGFAPHRMQLRVLPYSYTIDEAALHGLRAAAQAVLGDQTDVAIRPSVPFGAEASAANGLDPADRSVALSVALFNLASTPEHENHGAFLEALRPVAEPRLLALIDESSYRRRLGAAAGARDRLAERRHAWSAFSSSHAVPVAFVDLAAPDLAQLERDVEPVLAPAP